ncbi:hypothetical protein CR513_17279, partial [Mucuna pruriens]
MLTTKMLGRRGRQTYVQKLSRAPKRNRYKNTLSWTVSLTPPAHGMEELYDGTSDPNKHIDAYVTQVNLFTNNDIILCRVFLTSLKGATLN